MKNLIAYHKRAELLRKKLGSQREAWEIIEQEHFDTYNKYRYLNYNSFRQVHWQIITGHYRHLK
jgi:hypothetical protein